MTAAPVVAATTLLTGLGVAVSVRPMLRRLREPVDDPDAAQAKLPYRELGTPLFVLACTCLAMLAQLVSQTTLSPSARPAWTVLATCGVFLALVDARTTWLPRSVTYAGWALMVLAGGLSLGLGGGLAGLLRLTLGAAVAGILYLGVWLVTRGGFGFGDVRYAPLLGAATAQESWTLLIWGLTLGTVVGAVHGTVQLLRGRRRGFPYAPSMLAGGYLAAVALHLLLPGGGG